MSRLRPSRAPGAPASEADAYSAGLGMLSRRELSTAQLRQRLSLKGYEPDAIDGAIVRLLAAGALDDRRVALAAARTHAHVKHQGRERVSRELAALGLGREVIDEALAEVFREVDERELVERALLRRLRPRMSLADSAVRRRLFAALLRQGFSPDAIAKALKAHGHVGEDE